MINDKLDREKVVFADLDLPVLPQTALEGGKRGQTAV